jgi:hypothetical protein
VNINDIRVGMKLVFGQDDRRSMTKGKVYEVVKIEYENAGENGIVHVVDDRGVKLGFYAKRFERIAVDFPAAPHKFGLGEWVHHKDNPKRNFQVHQILQNGFMYLAEVRGIKGGFINTIHRKADKGYNPVEFRAMDAPAAAPEAPQQAAEAAPIPAYVPKIGDRVRLLDGNNIKGPAGWVDNRMAPMIGEEWEVAQVDLGRQVVYLENDPHRFIYNFKWLEPAVPARPFAVGDMVEEKKFPNRKPFKVLALLDDNRIDISFSDLLDVRMGTWKEDLFQLVARGNAPKAIINFKVGELAKVVKKASAKNAKWIDDMDDTIGDILKVVRYDDWAKAYELANGFLYSVECLEAPKEGEVPVKKKKAVAKKKFPNLKALIAKSRKEDIKGVGGVSSYVVFTKNKKTGEITPNKNLRDVCHARLALYYGREDIPEAVAVIDYQQQHEQQALAAGKQYKTSYRKFVDYIVNRSPWAVAFQGKTAKNVLENGVLMNVEAPSGAVAGACMALRYLSEFNAQNAVWKLMMDNGIQEDAAFLTTYAFIDEKDGTFTPHPMGGGHQAISGMIPAGSLISFFANGYDEAFLKSEPYRTKTSYRVHEHIENVKDVLRLPNSYISFVQANTEWTEVKEGWAVVKKATQEQVIAFAKRLEQLINKAREAKAAK